MGQFDHIAKAMSASPLMAVFTEMAESNDFSRLDKSNAKRHHFLPQLLLRRFGRPHDGNDCIFQKPEGAPARGHSHCRLATPTVCGYRGGWPTIEPT